MSNWIKNEGVMPVVRGTLVEVRHRDGDVLTDHAGLGYAKDWSLDPDLECDGDIMEYRLA